MTHTSTHKKKKFTTTPEQVPFTEKNKQARASGDKAPRSNITGEDISVGGTIKRRISSAQKAVDLFSGQLERGEFRNPLEETSLKNQLVEAKKLVGEREGITPEVFGQQRGFEVAGEEQEQQVQLTPQEQLGEDIKKGLIIGGAIGLPIAATIVTGGLLGVGLGIGTAGRAAASRGGQAVITRQVSRHQLDTLTGKLLARGTKQTQRAFTGRPGTNGALIEKLFKGSKNPLKRFASNQKSQAVTKSFLIKAGLGALAVKVIVDAIGTYPFAGFIKEEAVQQTGFAFSQAERNDDLVGMEEAIKTTEDILNSEGQIREKIPYVNILSELDGYFEAIEVKLETDKRTFAKKSGELKGGN